MRRKFPFKHHRFPLGAEVQPRIDQAHGETFASRKRQLARGRNLHPRQWKMAVSDKTGLGRAGRFRSLLG